MHSQIDICPRSNKVIDSQRERTGTSPDDWPITLAQVKSYLKMDGINEDDAIISEMIDEAIDWIENYCSISLIPQTVTVYLEVKNRIELPFGPVVSVDSINDITDFNADSLFPATGFVNLCGYGRYTVVYTAGYATIPASLIGALYAYIADVYEHRGDAYDETNPDFASVAAHKAFPFIRDICF